MKIKSTIAIMCITIAGSASAQLKYPTTHADASVVDDYFGMQVADPYRWLEDDNSAETAEWVKAQNAVSSAYLQKIPFRNALKNRLTRLFTFERSGAPFKRNGKYYFYRNDGLQNQSVLYEQATLQSEPVVFLDPNKLSDDGTVALTKVSFSPDGRYYAYVVARSGSDWNEIYVADRATHRLLDDHIMWAKFTGVEWLGDGFFYSCYDAPEGSELSSKNEYHKVKFHRIGTQQSDDRIEFQDLGNPLHFHSAEVSDDERFIFIYKTGGHGNCILVKDLKAENPEYKPLVPGFDDECGVVATDDKAIYIFTAKDAPRNRLVAVPVNDIRPEATYTVIPEAKNVMAGVRRAGDRFIVTYEIDASDHPQVYDLSGKFLYDITLPGIGSVGFSSSPKHSEVFYTFSSYTTPGSTYSLNLADGTSQLMHQPKLQFNPADFVTEEVTYTSNDGTPVHMFLTHKKGITKNGKNPTLLYGYGGFNISLTPAFNARIIPFLEAGGIYAVANLRGGSEYGEEWHEAGTKMKKQNVFDDFIAAAEWLIKEKYTSPKHLACNGGSNGGLLVGATINQRPDLFAAAVPQVGVMDMMRYHLFTIGWNWAGDYGRSDDSPEMAAYLRAYSPLHNIKTDGTRYPAVLVTTGDHDDRVVPAHSFKYAATLQAANTGKAPKIIRIDSKAGHGSGKPVAKQIEEYADIYGFIMYHLGMKPKWEE
ncbi:MAG: prolyl oligopeptidase family protein [Muribaculaceae bacterium]